MNDNDEIGSALGVAYEDFEPDDPAAPERCLLVAVLINAMSDLEKQGSSGRLARQFFMSTEDDYLFSFRSICSFLEVDPKRVLTVIGLNKKSENI